MDKKLQKELKDKLDAEKKRLTKDLSFFAKKDPKIKGNWLTYFPILGSSRSHVDESAEEIEEYEKLLPLEHDLELRLKDIDEALGNIKKKSYGQCSNCSKKIEIKRLQVVPEAKLCLKCGKQKP